MPVADCGCEQFGAHSKTEMKMAHYLDYWRSRMQQLQQAGGSAGGEERGVGDVGSTESHQRTGTLLYLKDWHFCKSVRISITHSLNSGLTPSTHCTGSFHSTQPSQCQTSSAQTG